VVLSENGALKIKVMAPAVDGCANKAVVDFLRKKLGIKEISIVGGSRSRSKIIDFGDDFSEEQILTMLLQK
jgi:uncharacterized protein (TIGR00251 family)